MMYRSENHAKMPPSMIFKDVGGWSYNPLSTGTPARIYAELLKLANPVVSRYHGDLYHDAIWVNEQFAEPFQGPGPEKPPTPWTFFYCVRDWGTHLYFHAEHAESVLHSWPDAHVYSIAVVCDDGQWLMFISKRVWTPPLSPTPEEIQELLKADPWGQAK